MVGVMFVIRCRVVANFIGYSRPSQILSEVDERKQLIATPSSELQYDLMNDVGVLVGGKRDIRLIIDSIRAVYDPFSASLSLVDIVKWGR